MGKAARRRKDYNRKYLSELSRKDLHEFDAAWEMRLDSWLTEVRYLAKDWAVGGLEAQKKIFGILDEALAILKSCDTAVFEKYAEMTHDLICNECCQQVSRVIDKRLYRLSNMDSLRFNAKRGIRV